MLKLTRWALFASVVGVLLVGVGTGAAKAPSAAVRTTTSTPTADSSTVHFRGPNLSPLLQRLLRRTRAFGRKQLATPLEKRYLKRKIRRWTKQQLINAYCWQVWHEYFVRRYGLAYAINWWAWWTHYSARTRWGYWYCRNNNYPPLN